MNLSKALSLRNADLSSFHEHLHYEYLAGSGPIEHHITKTFTFPNFREALTFVNSVGELAEQQGHHPDISLAWGKVGITTWTHKINGLKESDFILAAKVDQLFKS